MSTLDRDKSIVKKILYYLMATIIMVAVGAIYENHSFNVMSFYMIYGFCFPLGLGVLPLMVLMDEQSKERYGFMILEPLASMFWGFGVATLCIGCLVTGALEIYGTTNDLTKVYWLVGGGLLLYAVLRNGVVNRKSHNATG